MFFFIIIFAKKHVLMKFFVQKNIFLTGKSNNVNSKSFFNLAFSQNSTGTNLVKMNFTIRKSASENPDFCKNSEICNLNVLSFPAHGEVLQATDD